MLVIAGFPRIRLAAMAVVGGMLLACSGPERDAGPARLAERTPPLGAGSRPSQEEHKTIDKEAFDRSSPGSAPRAEPLADSRAAPAEADLGPMIVRRVEVSLRVNDVVKAAKALEARARTLGGYMQDSSLDLSGDIPAGRVVVRIPARRLEEFMGSVAGLGTLMRHTTSAEDVGLEFHDLEAQLRNWRAEERRLQELFGRAAKVSDLLEVERELARVRGQIDQATGRRDFLAHQVRYATITVELSQVAAPRTPPGWNALDVLREAGAALWETMLALVTLAIWLAVFAPLWVPAWLAGRWLWRRRGRRAIKTD